MAQQLVQNILVLHWHLVHSFANKQKGVTNSQEALVNLVSYFLGISLQSLQVLRHNVHRKNTSARRCTLQNTAFGGLGHIGAFPSLLLQHLLPGICVRMQWFEDVWRGLHTTCLRDCAHQMLSHTSRHHLAFHRLLREMIQTYCITYYVSMFTLYILIYTCIYVYIHTTLQCNAVPYQHYTALHYIHTCIYIYTRMPLNYQANSPKN